MRRRLRRQLSKRGFSVHGNWQERLHADQFRRRTADLPTLKGLVMKRTHSAVALVLVCLLVAPQASAGDMADSAARAATLSASISNAAKSVAASASQARPNARGSDENPYLIPAVVLMGVGGLVALYGTALSTPEVTCTESRTSFSCGSSRSKAPLIAGLGIAGFGVFLFYRGEQKKNSSPELVVGPHNVTLRKQIRW